MKSAVEDRANVPQKQFPSINYDALSEIPAVTAFVLSRSLAGAMSDFGALWTFARLQFLRPHDWSKKVASSERSDYYRTTSAVFK
jgi:hypothetical protein